MDGELRRQQAMETAASDLSRALATIEESCRANPGDARAWEDLARLRMKSELATHGHVLDETLRVFERALTLDPGNERIKQGLESCRKHQIARAFQGKLEHHVFPVPVFPGNGSKEYLSTMTGSAFVVKGAIPAERLAFLTLDYLKQRHGDTLVDYYSPDKNFQLDVSAMHVRIPMREALDRLENDERTYVMWNMKYRERSVLMKEIGLLDAVCVDEHWLDHVIPTDALRDELLLKTHWYQMVIGSRDSGMFNHYDVFENSGWHLHVRGRKRWHICHPDSTPNIRKYTKFGIGETNCFCPNYDSHPEFRKVVAYLGEFTTGDILYYPGQFWHQTHNVEDVNITLTCSAANKDNFRRVIACMKSCCSQGLPYPFSRELCRALEPVYAYWNEKFGIVGHDRS